jgi:hypothetical protein
MIRLDAAFVYSSADELRQEARPYLYSAAQYYLPSYPFLEMDQTD